MKSIHNPSYFNVVLLTFLAALTINVTTSKLTCSIFKKSWLGEYFIRIFLQSSYLET